ncbi:FadR/GntR family transcriptional regulator [Desulfobotulus sp.]|jgi:DNA-binding FadR family transcriptional regulator|uniref:FadR/GntR family transcriptional regulator n=1 Tax=Desulfobotulus sp. TaxID=1940337 RepID=UPI002A361418|nr:GntR family transcriptional regulator [Desulfobotulus sp.]MDY0164238.1 GntR family transcriptional regulator [Desulfobotulus sp.]
MTDRRADIVFKALQRDILSGIYPEKTRLPSERVLGEMHGVSRITIRDAISRLVQLGLVEKQPQSGIYVRRFKSEASLDLLIHLMQTEGGLDTDTLLSLLEFRRLAAVFIVRKAARNPDRTGLLRLQTLLEETEASLAQGREAEKKGAAEATPQQPLSLFDSKTPPAWVQTLAEADFSFHAGIVAMTDNMVAQLLFNSFKPAYRHYSLFFYALPGAAETALQNHRELLAALSAGDEDYAAWKMEQTLTYAENRVKDALREQASSGKAPFPQ